jgi:hypothetical protein
VQHLSQRVGVGAVGEASDHRVEDARQLWNLTHDKRLFVHVYGAWD